MRINRTLLHWTRTVHIYLTMAGLVLMLFFAITGFTANHEEWFGATTPRTTNLTGKTPPNLLTVPNSNDKLASDKLGVVEHLRANYPVAGAMTDYETDREDEIRVVFKGAGRITEAKITRPAGHTTVEVKTFGLVGRMNDLHRARDTGDAWRIIVDISAALIVLACISGVILWLVLPKRRKYGIGYVIVGVGVSVAFYLWVP